LNAEIYGSLEAVVTAPALPAMTHAVGIGVL